MIKIWILFIAISFSGSHAAWAQPTNIVIAGGGIRCPIGAGADYCEIDSRTLPDTYGGLAADRLATGIYLNQSRTLANWCIQNRSTNDVFIPTGTFDEFQSFITASTDATPIAGVTVSPCCDPTQCTVNNGNCAACVNVGVLGPANCCDWACSGPTDTISVSGHECCQDVNNPPGPPFDALRGGACGNTCPDSSCDPWESLASCCSDCSGGFCGGNGCCQQAGGLFPETTVNCCTDCGAFAGDGVCNCGETCLNSPADCSCTAPNTCGGGGTPGVCGCTVTTCVAQGANCGTIDDGCGTPLDCGSCSLPDTCGGGGTPNVCGGGCPDGPDCSDGCCGANENNSICPNECMLAWCDPAPGYNVNGTPFGGGPTECDRGWNCPANSVCYDATGIDRDYTCENPRVQVAPDCCTYACKNAGYSGGGICAGGQPANTVAHPSYSCDTDAWGGTHAGEGCWCVTSTCSNGVQDGGEEGVDCGPVCGNACSCDNTIIGGCGCGGDPDRVPTVSCGCVVSCDCACTSWSGVGDCGTNNCGCDKRYRTRSCSAAGSGCSTEDCWLDGSGCESYCCDNNGVCENEDCSCGDCNCEPRCGGSGCGCSGPVDCAGTCNGSATVDCTGTCDGGCPWCDCEGTCQGGAWVDCEGTCGGSAQDFGCGCNNPPPSCDDGFGNLICC